MLILILLLIVICMVLESCCIISSRISRLEEKQGHQKNETNRQSSFPEK